MRTAALSLTLFALFACHLQGESREELVVRTIRERDAPLSEENRRAKYLKMSQSSFAFFRGTNYLFWQDLGNSKLLERFGSPRTKIWLHGDLHAENFGSFLNARNELVYDFNDIDDSIIADYQLDLWRLATSIVLVTEHHKLKPEQRTTVLAALCEAYLQSLKDCRFNNREIQFQLRLANAYGRLDEFLDNVADTQSRPKMVEEWTVYDSRGARFKLSEEKLRSLKPEHHAILNDAIKNYQATIARPQQFPAHFFQVKDAAQRVFSGTGSLGVPRFYLLIEGYTRERDDDRILDVKQQLLPSGYAYLSKDQRDELAWFTATGLRHQVAYRALLPDADSLLGWTKIGRAEFSVRERSPMKQTLDLNLLNSTTRLSKVAQQWATITANRHARADKDSDPERFAYQFEEEMLSVVARREVEFTRFVAQLAIAYASRVERDYQTFQANFIDKVTPAQ